MMVDTITFCEKSQERLTAEMVAKKHQLCPQLNDDNIASVNMTMIELFSTQLAWLIGQVNVIANQNYIKTATLWDALKHLCALLAYQIPTATASTATVDVTFRSSFLADEIRWPRWKQFATTGSSTEEKIIFESTAELVKMPGSLTASVPVIQGERIATETLGSSDGSDFQRFTLLNYPVIIDDYLEIYVVDETASTTTKWTRVQSLMAYNDSTAEVYEVDYTEDTELTIIFGNGTYGKIPPIGTNNIYANYRVGGGTIGNVGIGKIVSMVSTETGFESCTNAAAASGGIDKEETKLTRMKAPWSIKYSDRVVAREDYAIRAMEYVGVTRAKEFVREFGENTTGLRIVPTSTTITETALANLLIEVKNWVEKYNTTTHEVYVNEAKYHTVNITATITITSSADEDEVDTAIDTALDIYFNPRYIDDEGEWSVAFGQKIRRSKLMTIIHNAHDDITNVALSIPASDITVNAYELPGKGTIDLTYVREASS
jgi:hypothetical protein